MNAQRKAQIEAIVGNLRSIMDEEAADLDTIPKEEHDTQLTWDIEDAVEEISTAVNHLEKILQ